MFSGYLNKRTNPVSPPPMQRVFCVLWGSLLMDFENEEEAKQSMCPRTVVELLGVSPWDGKGRANTYPHGFLLVTHTGSTYYVSVPTIQERDEWLLHLKRGLECVFANADVSPYKPCKMLSHYPSQGSNAICPRTGIQLAVTLSYATAAQAAAALSAQMKVQMQATAEADGSSSIGKEGASGGSSSSSSTGVTPVHCKSCGRGFSSLEHLGETSTLLQVGSEECVKMCYDCKHAQMCVLWLKTLNYAILMQLHELTPNVYKDTNRFNASFLLRRRESERLEMASKLQEAGNISAYEFEELRVVDHAYRRQHKFDEAEKLSQAVCAFGSDMLTIIGILLNPSLTQSGGRASYFSIIRRILEIADTAPDLIDFYLPQLIQVHLQESRQFTPEAFMKVDLLQQALLVIAQKYPAIGLKLAWSLMASIGDYSEKRISQISYAACVCLLLQLEMAVTGLVSAIADKPTCKVLSRVIVAAEHQQQELGFDMGILFLSRRHAQELLDNEELERKQHIANFFNKPPPSRPGTVNTMSAAVTAVTAPADGSGDDLLRDSSEDIVKREKPEEMRNNSRTQKECVHGKKRATKKGEHQHRHHNSHNNRHRNRNSNDVEEEGRVRSASCAEPSCIELFHQLGVGRSTNQAEEEDDDDSDNDDDDDDDKDETLEDSLTECSICSGESPRGDFSDSESDSENHSESSSIQSDGDMPNTSAHKKTEKNEKNEKTKNTETSSESGITGLSSITYASVVKANKRPTTPTKRSGASATCGTPPPKAYISVNERKQQMNDGEGSVNSSRSASPRPKTCQTESTEKTEKVHRKVQVTSKSVSRGRKKSSSSRRNTGGKGGKHRNSSSGGGSSGYNGYRSGSARHWAQQAESFAEQLDFVDTICELVESLRFVDRPLRTEILVKEMSKWNKDPAKMLGWDPTTIAGEPSYRIQRVIPEECRVFRTKARAPSMIVCEVVRDDVLSLSSDQNQHQHEHDEEQRYQYSSHNNSGAPLVAVSSLSSPARISSPPPSSLPPAAATSASASSSSSSAAPLPLPLPLSPPPRRKYRSPSVDELAEVNEAIEHANTQASVAAAVAAAAASAKKNSCSNTADNLANGDRENIAVVALAATAGTSASSSSSSSSSSSYSSRSSMSINNNNNNNRSPSSSSFVRPIMRKRPSSVLSTNRFSQNTDDAISKASPLPVQGVDGSVASVSVVSLVAVSPVMPSSSSATHPYYFKDDEDSNNNNNSNSNSSEAGAGLYRTTSNVSISELGVGAAAADAADASSPPTGTGTGYRASQSSPAALLSSSSSSAAAAPAADNRSSSDGSKSSDAPPPLPFNTSNSNSNSNSGITSHMTKRVHSSALRLLQEGVIDEAEYRKLLLSDQQYREETLREEELLVKGRMESHFGEAWLSKKEKYLGSRFDMHLAIPTANANIVHHHSNSNSNSNSAAEKERERERKQRHSVGHEDDHLSDLQQQQQQHLLWPAWDLKSFIVKSNDDLRQEVCCLQIMTLCKEIFAHFNLDSLLWLSPYRIISTGASTGFVQVLNDTISLDGLKKTQGFTTLSNYFRQMYDTSEEVLATAKRNFACSLAAYSLFSYILLIKDRHNGNMLLDTEGHIIHIDFGFLLGIAPGGSFSLESAPFKLTEEMVELLGGLDSPLFGVFVSAFTKGFVALQANAEVIIGALTILAENSSFPCFAGKPVQPILDKLRARFRQELNVNDVVKHCLDLITNSYGHYGTRQYDYFQWVTNGIVP